MPKTEKPHTPTWMKVSDAARGWGVSVSQAYRIIEAAEDDAKRPMRSHGRIRVSDYLAIPRGDVAAAPMIPEVAILWEKLEALAEQQQRILVMLAKVSRRAGMAP